MVENWKRVDDLNLDPETRKKLEKSIEVVIGRISSIEVVIGMHAVKIEA